MNGWIRIGTKIEKEKFEIQYKQLMIELEELEEKNKSLEETMNDNRGAIQSIADEIKKANEGLLSEEQIYDRMVGLIDAFGTGVEETFVNFADNMSIEEAYAKTLEVIQGGITDELKEQEKQHTKNDLKIKSFNIRVQELKNNLHKATKNSNLFGHHGTQDFKSLLKGAKRLVLGIIGIQSAYSIVRRAVSSYMSTDEKYTKQMEANWIGLGATLSPIIDWISKSLRKIVTGVLYFISVLTDVNMIQKANSVILKKNAEATKNWRKENEKLTTSFDEMEVLQDRTEKEKPELLPLFDINDLSKSTIDKITRIAKALKPIYNFFKDLVQFGIDHPELIVTILGGMGLLSFINKVIGNKNSLTGLLGIHGILAGISGYIIGKNLADIYETYNDVINTMQSGKNLQEPRLEEIKNRYNELASQKREIINKKDAKSTSQYTKEIKNQTIALINNAKRIKNNMDNMSATDKFLAKQSGAWDRWNEEIALSLDYANDYTNILKELYENGSLNTEQMGDYNEAVATLTDTIFTANGGFTELAKTYLKVERGVERLGVVQEELGYKFNQTKDFALTLGQTIKDIPEKVRIDIISDSANKVKKVIDNTLSSLGLLSSKTWTYKIKATASIDVKTLLNGFVQNAANTALWALALSNMQSQWNSAIKMVGLANGGIVHNPGRGVPIGSNILVGEGKDAEAVLPLNEQTYSMLGKSIAENMVVNLTNITEMNGRQINKEIKQISAKENYAFNV